MTSYHSSYKSCLLQLQLLPLMYLLGFNNLLFFIKSYKTPSDHFDINSYVTFSHSTTRSSLTNKLLHLPSSSNLNRHFYFSRLPCLWNALPPIDLNFLLNRIKNQIFKYLSQWEHETLIFVCPCSS